MAETSKAKSKQGEYQIFHGDNCTRERDNWARNKNAKEGTA
jgi:hypothetical protein